MTGLTNLGSCQCRRVTFEVQAKLDYAIDCNCSLCRRKGALWHGVSDSSKWVVNVRCIDGIDLSSIAIRSFDGEHWEEAAKAFLEARNKRPNA